MGALRIRAGVGHGDSLHVRAGVGHGAMGVLWARAGKGHRAMGVLRIRAGDGCRRLTLNPPPTSPSTFSTGTLVFSKWTSHAATQNGSPECKPLRT